MTIVERKEGLYTYEFFQKIVPGVTFSARSTIVELGGTIVIISPGPFDQDTIENIKALGQRYLIIAPNLFHHFYFLNCQSTFPNSQLYAPRVLANKVDSLEGQYKEIEQLPVEITSGLTPIEIKGNKLLGEWVFYNQKTKTMIVTDLLFNMKDRPFLTNVMLRLAGTYNRVAQSRLVKFTVDDKVKFRQSLQSLVKFDVARVIMAHGNVIESGQIWQSFLDQYQ